MEKIMTPEEWYNNLFDKPDFTKLTSTGISTDYKNVFKFAEDYHKEKMKQLTKNGYYCPKCERNVDGVEVTFEENCDFCGTKLL